MSAQPDPGTPIFDELFNLLHPPLPPTKAYVEMMMRSGSLMQHPTPGRMRVQVPAAPERWRRLP